MKIEINEGSIVKLHYLLGKRHKVNYQTAGYEHNSVFPKDTGNLLLKSYDFGNGLNFHNLTGNVLKTIKLQFNEYNDNVIRYLFVKEGDLIVTLTSNSRYRLASGYSSIIAVRVPNNQLFTFPTQGKLELFVIEINTERFAKDMEIEYIGLPKELSDVFMNNVIDEHFVYHSRYVLSVADTNSEIANTKTDGIIKRFFLESKVLELLWLQTEQYKHELLNGYDDQILRKFDLQTIKEAKDYIHNNFNSELTLSVLAKYLGTNETKLKIGFKKIFGRTFSEILRTERLNNAKLLVQNSSLSLTEIAGKCGYKSVSMFRMRFKERFGVTPSQFQRSCMVKL